MHFQKLQRYCSRPRVQKYLQTANGDQQKAKRLYEANLRLAQSFHPLIDLFEVFLRNKIHEKLSGYFGDPDWILNQRSGFMSHLELGPKYFMRSRVEKTIDELNRRRQLSTGKVIAEQTLGFWGAMFDRVPFRETGASAIHIFPNGPRGIGRRQVNSKLHEIRKFRNRLFHNEPICFVQGTWDLSYAEDRKQDLFDFLDWMDPDLRAYASSFDDIQGKIDQARNLP